MTSTNRYLLKIAEQADLQPHQERALSKLEKNKGVILNHSTGSGKTKTFLTAIARDQKNNKESRTLLVAPAPLISNIHKEIAKHKLKVDLKKVDLMSYEKATNSSNELRKNTYTLGIADEAHKLRNVGTKRHSELGDLIAGADHRLLATATTSYNHISDTAPLVNIAAGGLKVLPEGKKAFEEAYVTKEVHTPGLLKRMMGHPSKEFPALKNEKDLKDRVGKYTDTYDLKDDPESAKHFPTHSTKTIEVEMSPEQHNVYKYLEGRLPWHLRLKVRSGLPLDKKESAQLNAFSTGIRQASTSTRAFMPQYDHITPKIHAAVDSLTKGLNTDKSYKGLVYSNYLQSGVDDYARELTKRGIPHNVYTGSTSKTDKDRMVQEYNSGKNKVLLISSSGAEGLDLKGTRTIQILDPHWNESKIKQIQGRGIRYKSHEDLPVSERHVNIEKYHSVFPSGVFGKSRTKSIDQYLADNSEDKDSLNTRLQTLLKSK